MNTTENIVVTGIGVVSPVGIVTEVFWKAVCNGEYGIKPITRFETADFKFVQAGEVRDFSVPQELDELAAEDLCLQFAATATAEAVRNARFPRDADLSDTGLIYGTNFAGMASAEKLFEELHGGPPAVPEDFTHACFQSTVDAVAAHYDMRGPRQTLSLSCSSGAAAVGLAAETIRNGGSRRMLAGGFDVLSRFAWSGLSALRTMTDDRIRPFDKMRKGTIFSEGAGVLMLEKAEDARQRGAPILATIAGWATNNNAYHMTAPAKGGAGSAAVMEAALKDAGITPRDIDHINAHGTGTRPNDVTETEAIKSVFGDAAENILLTSIKSNVGHMMGAAGAVETAAAILSIRDNIIPPTINFENPDPECDLPCVFNEKRETEINTVLSNSAGIGGCNAAVIVKQYSQ